jgi:hypothetical protein
VRWARLYVLILVHYARGQGARREVAGDGFEQVHIWYSNPQKNPNDRTVIDHLMFIILAFFLLFYLLFYLFEGCEKMWQTMVNPRFIEI